MSATVVTPGEAVQAPEPESSSVNYLNVSHTLKSWLLTGDHKRIAVLYLISVSFFFFLGSVAASLVRLELTSPNGMMMESETYNKMFSAHGIIMIFFFLIPSIPAIFGNFLIPIMIGARDLAFPRLNLASWYMYMVAGVLVLASFMMGGVESGWTFYTPYSSLTTSQVTICLVGLFIMGFSSIATGLNFIVTIHKMRAPGMTWDRLPLFVWAHYATSIIIILGTPVVAITLLLVVMERTFDIGVFNPANGGDPVLFQHMFWFYSHPAVYIMVLPGMGVISELISNFSQKRIFGYYLMAYSTLAIALLGFLVWGHHMFVAGQSMYQGVVFSLLSFILAVPSAIKVFNWTATLYKGQVRLLTPMIFALGFIGLFLIGGLTGLYLACLAVDVHLTATYFIVAHFHYVMVGGSMVAFLGALHYWWPKMFGRMYNQRLSSIAAVLVLIGFNATFLPQFVMGSRGMPRRYFNYLPEFQGFHVASTIGSWILALGLFLALASLLASFKKRKQMVDNPWGGKTLEWETASPPTMHNFEGQPVLKHGPYDYRPPHLIGTDAH